MIISILYRILRRYALRRDPDYVIGDGYLYRWWLIPRNPIFNIYLHKICADDDDRALHDHPWINISILLNGGYWEHLRGGVAIRRCEGSVVFRMPSTAHRLEMINGLPVWSLFITGPRVREWGFLCPQGWRHWRDFVQPGNPGQIGRGCD